MKKILLSAAIVLLCASCSKQYVNDWAYVYLKGREYDASICVIKDTSYIKNLQIAANQWDLEHCNNAAPIWTGLDGDNLKPIWIQEVVQGDTMIDVYFNSDYLRTREVFICVYYEYSEERGAALKDKILYIKVCESLHEDCSNYIIIRVDKIKNTNHFNIY